MIEINNKFNVNDIVYVVDRSFITEEKIVRIEAQILSKGVIVNYITERMDADVWPYTEFQLYKTKEEAVNAWTKK